MKKRRHPPGIARYRGAWRVYVTVQGVYRSKIIREERTEQELKHEREALRVDLRRELAGDDVPKPERDETLKAAAVRYLAAVRAMPTYKERERDIGLWVAALGHRKRRQITAAEIRAVREQWLLHGPKMVQRASKRAKTPGHRRPVEWASVKGPLSASTVNHRLRALANLYTVLDGKHARNPAREVAEVDEPDDAPRAIPPDFLDLILAALPDRGHQAEAGKKRPKVSQAKARIAVMAAEGLPPAQVKLIRLATDVDWEAPAIYVKRRKKGKGVKGGWRPLTQAGVEALRAFESAGAEGDFSTSTLRRAFRRACRDVEKALAKKGITADLSRLRLYDLRHTFATGALAATRGNLAAVQLLLQQADQRTTLRYTRAAVPALLADAAAQIDASRAAEKAAATPAEDHGPRAQGDAPTGATTLHANLHVRRTSRKSA